SRPRPSLSSFPQPVSAAARRRTSPKNRRLRLRMRFYHNDREGRLIRPGRPASSGLTGDETGGDVDRQSEYGDVECEGDDLVEGDHPADGGLRGGDIRGLAGR